MAIIKSNNHVLLLVIALLFISPVYGQKFYCDDFTFTSTDETMLPGVLVSKNSPPKGNQINEGLSPGNSHSSTELLRSHSSNSWLGTFSPNGLYSNKSTASTDYLNTPERFVNRAMNAKFSHTDSLVDWRQPKVSDKPLSPYFPNPALPRELTQSINASTKPYGASDFENKPLIIKKPNNFRIITPALVRDEIKTSIKDVKLAYTLYDIYLPKSDSCTESVVNRYDIDYYSIKSPDTYKLVKEFIDSEMDFAKKHPSLSIAMYKDFVSTARELLSKCYIPAEKSSFSKQYNVLRKVGAIYIDEEPVCTGLIFNSANKVLTARHCFETIAKGMAFKQAWFKPANGVDAHQVCAISEKAALDLNQFSSAEKDQIFIRIAAKDTPAGNVKIASRESLSPLGKGNSFDNLPTELRQISLFEFARLVSPYEFNSGFVESVTGSCMALAKENGCFIHTCSTIPGGSGASIFLAHTDQLTLIGTHIGASSDNTDCTSDKRVKFNVATYIRGLR